MPDFRERSTEAELMDSPDVPAEEMRRTLRELEVINSLLGGYTPTLRGIATLLPATCRSVRILDVGTGGGDTPRRIVRWAARRGIRASVCGVDRSASAVEYARETARGERNLVFERADVLELEVDEPFDVVHAALTLHHFDDENAVRVLRRMHGLCRWGTVINDLERHPLAYHSIAWLTRLLSRSRLIRNDAPLSVLRAFTRDELSRLVADAGLPAPRIVWRWAFRWQVVIPKSGGGE